MLQANITRACGLPVINVGSNWRITNTPELGLHDCIVTRPYMQARVSHFET